MAERAPSPRGIMLEIARVVTLYAAFAGLWIVFSDTLVDLLIDDTGLRHLVNTLKGFAFVAITSVLLFFLLMRKSPDWWPNHRRLIRRPDDNAPAPARRRDLLVSLVAIILGLAGLATVAVLHNWQETRQATQAQLLSIANLKVAQLGSWLRERHGDTRLAGSSPVIADALVRWRKTGKPEDQARLLNRLEAYRTAFLYQSVLICDDQGKVVIESGAHEHFISDPLRAAIHRAIASGEVETTDLFRMTKPDPSHIHLDFVAPLSAPEAAGLEPLVIILRADVDTAIYPLLETWPIPSDSAESLLFRKDGDHVLALNDFRHQPGTALSLRAPISPGQILPAQALAPGYRPGQALQGIDYRAVPVLGVAQPVPGTPWWLVAKIDRAEVLARVYKESFWTVIATLFTMLAASVLVMLLLQRRELQHSDAQRRDQEERLRALNLLAAIADNASDAMYAKDRDGRYTFFNRAACQYFGKTEAEVVGHFDRELIGAEGAAKFQANDLAVMNEDRVYRYEEILDSPDGERVFISIKGPLHDQQGCVIGVYGVSRDVTEHSREEAALRESNAELQRFNLAMIGREHEMIRLKREINALASQLGRPAPYDMSVFDTPFAMPAGATEAKP